MKNSPEQNYESPVHWGVYADGLRIYRGDNLRETITVEMLKAGMLEELARMLARS